MSVFSVLKDAATKWPQDEAVIHNERTCRYGELYAAAESLADELRSLGVEEGDKVGLLCGNGPEYIAAAFAVLRVGGVVASISPVSRTEEIARLAEEMALNGFCYGARFTPLMPNNGKRVSRRLPIFSGTDPLVVTRLRGSVPDCRREQLVKIEAATIRYSSGTTGKAKGIVVSHTSLLERAKTYCEAPPLRKDDAILWLRPMARSEIYAFLLQGVKIVIGDAMKTRSLAGLLQQHGITRIYAAPMFYRAILNESELTARDFRDVRYFLSGGSALGQPVADAFAVKYGREIVEHYGLAECGSVFINLSQATNKRGSIGLPVRAEAKLVSAGGNPLEGVATGELLVRSPGLFDVYYMPWRSRDEVLEDGWFRTGDVARRDKDGYYWIVGRTKEMIDVGGIKVSPYEVEEVLLSHPAVEEALVYGAPEPRFGEVPRAKVKLRAGAECTEKEILGYANERLSVFKTLRAVRFVNEVPKTSTGKVRRWP